MFSESFILEIIFIETQGAVYDRLSIPIKGFCHFPDLLLHYDIRLTILVIKFLFDCVQQLTAYTNFTH